MGSNLSCSLTPPVCVPNEELSESIKNPPICQSGKSQATVVAPSMPGILGSCPDGQTSVKSCCK